MGRGDEDEDEDDLLRWVLEFVALLLLLFSHQVILLMRSQFGWVWYELFANKGLHAAANVARGMNGARDRWWCRGDVGMLTIKRCTKQERGNPPMANVSALVEAAKAKLFPNGMSFNFTI